jgi:hypothetical protein
VQGIVNEHVREGRVGGSGERRALEVTSLKGAVPVWERFQGFKVSRFQGFKVAEFHVSGHGSL